MMKNNLKYMDIKTFENFTLHEDDFSKKDLISSTDNSGFLPKINKYFIKITIKTD